jgi:hypothetical protein
LFLSFIKAAGTETMDKMQAKKIRRHLFAIDNAIDKAFAAIFELNKEDRRPFIDGLGELDPVCILKCWSCSTDSIQNCARLPCPLPSAAICGGKT